MEIKSCGGRRHRGARTCQVQGDACMLHEYLIPNADPLTYLVRNADVSFLDRYLSDAVLTTKYPSHVVSVLTDLIDHC